MQCTPLAVTYGAHFAAVLYPLSIIEMSSSLERKGYELSPSIPYPRPLGRLTGSGEIARKGKTSIHVDSGAQLLLVADETTESAVERFDELVSALSEDHGLDVVGLIRFYAFSATYEVRTKNEATQKIGDKLNVQILKDFKEILGEAVQPIELKLGSGLKANTENWLDISFRPNYERNDRYVISVVYRNTDATKTREFVKAIEERVVAIAELIDG